MSKRPFTFPALKIVVAGAGAAMLSSCAMMPSISPRSPGPEQIFATPEQAADALVAANREDGTAGIIRVLGPRGEDLVSSGDPVADKKIRDRFLNAYQTMHRLEPQGADRDMLVVGAEEWPLPIPLVRVAGGWQFDTEAGTQEILNRRIGRNELDVIQVCRAFVEAEEDYAAMTPGRHAKPVYAQHFISTQGTHDGLYWPVKAGQAESPLGQLIADARADGYATGSGHHAPYHGYYYKILKAQGADAIGGAKSYLDSKGRMSGGFALLAFPAKYGDSGVMSFIVNQDGIIYEKNLGPETSEIAGRIDAFDPDDSWTTVGAGNLLGTDDDSQ